MIIIIARPDFDAALECFGVLDAHRGPLLQMWSRSAESQRCKRGQPPDWGSDFYFFTNSRKE